MVAARKVTFRKSIIAKMVQGNRFQKKNENNSCEQTELYQTRHVCLSVDPPIQRILKDHSANANPEV